MKKILLFLVLFVVIFPVSILAVSCSDSCSNSQACNEVVNACTAQISTLQGQANTLSNQIAQFNAQINLGEVKIQQTEDEIQLLSDRIGQVQGSLTDLTKAFTARAVATYKMERMDGSTYFILSSNDLKDAVNKLRYLQEAENSDQSLLTRLQSAKVTYENSKKQTEDLQKQLQQQQSALTVQKAAKQTLLTQTQGSEANYQKLLNSAIKQLASFSAFVDSQGGASLLSGQTSCDDWGCYYNQRDSQWGNVLINGQGGYSMAGYGCLITSVSMILSHMGHREVLPFDIAASSNANFAVGTALLRYSINVKGVSVNRSTVSLDAALQNGPVIAGIYAYGGTHFVVLKSGNSGNYVMDDPYLPNGKNMNFTDHYSISSIFEVDNVSIN